MNILIVEDDFIARKGIMESINWEANGLSICGEASNGQEGIEIARLLKPEIVITDIKMPIVDGLGLSKLLYDELPETRIILLTAYEDFGFAKQAIQLRVKQYLLKPVNADELLKTVIDLRDEIKLVNNIGKRHPVDGEDLNHKYTLEIRSALEYIHANYHSPLSLQIVADEIFYTSSYFSKVFKEEVGVNFVDYVNNLRINKAKKLLCNVDLKGYQVAELVGFQNYKYFNSIFSKIEGCSPMTYRNKKMR